MSTRTPCPRPANSSDFREVSILFADEVITGLFAELLESRGVKTKILAKADDHNENTRIVTEPQFFGLLDSLSQARCLVVGNKEIVDQIAAIGLTRPLTEQKIESALEEFLGG